MPPTRNSFHELCDSSPIQEKKKKEQPTTAIKYQFAPTPLTCFLPAVCSLLLRGLFQTEVKVQFNFHL